MKLFNITLLDRQRGRFQIRPNALCRKRPGSVPWSGGSFAKALSPSPIGRSGSNVIAKTLFGTASEEADCKQVLLTRVGYVIYMYIHVYAPCPSALSISVRCYLLLIAEILRRIVENSGGSSRVETGGRQRSMFRHGEKVAIAFLRMRISTVHATYRWRDKRASQGGCRPFQMGPADQCPRVMNEFRGGW